MNYAKFQGKRIEDVCTHNADKSFYNHNYYIDDEGNEIFEWCNDDGYFCYSYNGIDFAEAFFNADKIIEVYDEFLK